MQSQLRQHIKLADNFSTSLKSVFDQYRGLRKPRRTAEEKENDKRLALDGDSSSKMTEVWEVWEATTIRILERSDSYFPPLGWAWNQRFASCPPLHHTFRIHLLDPLDTQDVEPVEKPVPSSLALDWPCSNRELALVRPWPGVSAPAIEPEVEEIEAEVEIRRSGRLKDKVPPKKDEEQSTKASGGGWGNSRRRTRKNNGGGGGGTWRGRSTSRKPLRADGILAIKAEEEHQPGMPHPVWDIIDIDEEPRQDSSTLEKLTLYVKPNIEPVDGHESDGEQITESISIAFYTGMVSLQFCMVAFFIEDYKTEDRTSTSVEHAECP